MTHHQDIESARKLAASAKATRPAVEEAISKLKGELANDEAELATLAEERAAALVAGGEKLKDHKARQAQTEELAETRRALIDALTKKRDDLLEDERRDEMANARAHAEELQRKAAEALGRYPAARTAIMEIVEAVKHANAAADHFERRYIDEPRIGRAEALVRKLADMPEEVLSEEKITLWAYEDGGHPVPESSAVRIELVEGSNRGRIPISSGFRKVERRQFRKVAYLPAVKAEPLPSIVSEVELPAFIPERQRSPSERLEPVKDGLVSAAITAISDKLQRSA